MGEAASHTSGKEFSASVPQVVGGKATSSETVGENSTDSLMSVFDPHWANARAFLNYLNEHDLIHRDIADVELGQFVMVSGFLNIQDLVMFKEAWKLDSIKKLIKKGAGIGAPMGNLTSAQKAEAKEQQGNLEMLLELIQIMPHAIHATLLESGDRPVMVWCSLREEYMAAPASEFQLLHGDYIPGQWTMLGILSAGPDVGVDVPNEISDLEPGVMQSIVGVMSKSLSPVIRLSLGRPRVAFAVTPLLIFREVS